MHNFSSQDRIRNLYQMLFEMATGNLSFRLAPGSQHDEIDVFAKALNKVADEMQAVIVKNGYVVPKFIYQGVVQAALVLDNYGTIRSFSSETPFLLDYQPEQLYGRELTTLLAPTSMDKWMQLKQLVDMDDQYHSTVQLLLNTGERKVIPSFCTVMRLSYSTKILISFIATWVKSPADVYGLKPVPARKQDSAVVQSVYDFILQNLEEPLPSVRELARMFGTNEFKLKDGFRHFFKTSIYQFYNEERLKKAHLLIQPTVLPIKTIAYMSGFNDYTNFYKSFKKRYDYSPSDVKRIVKLK